MSDRLSFCCWRCGELVADVLLPLSRTEMCPHCRADLHVCRQCTFYDTSKASACREPVAEHVNDKTRANFCGYLAINTALSLESDNNPEQAAALNDLFGLNGDSDTASPSTADQAQSALDELFGLDEKDNNN